MKLYTMQYGLIFLLLFSLTLTACQRGATDADLSDVGLEMSLAPEPLQVGLTTVTLDLTDANGNPITGATIELEGNMSHAGMAPSFAQASEVGNGRYEAPLEFTMGGDWFIVIKANLPDGRQLERQIDVPGVETP